MSEPRYPNESKAYRRARDRLLKDEQALIDKTKAVAKKRRQLPLGGRLKEDSVFQWAVDGKIGKPVKCSRLFGDKKTLLIYSFMFGPNWDNPCLSCTSLVDGFDRTWYQVSRDAAFVAIAKAPAHRINAWAKKRGWTQMALVSGYNSTYQADYKCQDESNDDMQWPVMHCFRKRGGKIYHFWGTELSGNHVDTVWPYWNLHAGGAARVRCAPTKIQVQIPGEKLPTRQDLILVVVGRGRHRRGGSRRAPAAGLGGTPSPCRLGRHRFPPGHSFPA